MDRVITAEMFKEATGQDPTDDDLERCNCDKAGEPLHSACGWCEIHNLPLFMDYECFGKIKQRYPSIPQQTERRFKY